MYALALNEQGVVISRQFYEELNTQFAVNEIEVDWNTFLKADSIAPVKYIDGVIVPFEKPSSCYVWVNNEWVVDAGLLAEARSKRWLLLKQYRDAIKQKGVNVNGFWFHTDDGSRIQFLQLERKAEKVLANGGTSSTVLTVMTLQGESPINNWKTMSGARTAMTVDIAQKLPLAVELLDALCFGVCDYHLLVINNSLDPDNYNFMTLWPTVYTG